MTAAVALTRLHDAGLTVTADAGDLVVKPASRLTPELRAVILAEKAALLALLAPPQGMSSYELLSDEPPPQSLASWSETGRSWFCPCGANVVIHWSGCPFCGERQPKQEERSS
jgi:hypothetical protein